MNACKKDMMDVRFNTQFDHTGIKHLKLLNNFPARLASRLFTPGSLMSQAGCSGKIQTTTVFLETPNKARHPCKFTNCPLIDRFILK